MFTVKLRIPPNHTTFEPCIYKGDEYVCFRHRHADAVALAAELEKEFAREAERPARLTQAQIDGGKRDVPPVKSVRRVFYLAART